MKVRARAGTPFTDKDAIKISRVFNKIFPSGEVTPDGVLKEASRRSSPLHDYFEWDDTLAANKYRRSQARKMIQSLVVEIDDIPVRKYVSPIIVEAGKPKKYYEIQKAMANKSIWDQVLQQALQEANAFRTRYTHLKELTAIHAAIDKTSKKHRRKNNG